MSKTNKIVAAVLAARSASAMANRPLSAEAYLDEYELFIRLLDKRDRAAKEAKKAAASTPPEKGPFER